MNDQNEQEGQPTKSAEFNVRAAIGSEARKKEREKLAASETNNDANTETMAAGKDTQCLPGQMNFNLWTQGGHPTTRRDPLLVDTAAQDLRHLPESTEEMYGPGAYDATPGRELERAGTPRFSLVGLTPEEMVSIGIQDTADSGSFLDHHREPHNSQTDTGLAIATEVQGSSRPMEIPRAESVHIEPEATEATAKKKKKIMEQDTMKCYAAVGFLLLLAIVATVVAVVLTNTGNRGNSQKESFTKVTTTAGAGSNSTISSSMPNLEHLFHSLPNATKEILLLDEGTSQSKAWKWLMQHQNITNLPEWRKKQLFALATFYFAMEGPTWPKEIRKAWLNDTINECSWINTSLEHLNGLAATYLRRTDLDFHPCNAKGEVQTIALTRLALSKANPFIPPEVALLPSLTILVLLLNEITAPLSNMIPTELYQLTNLEVLVLHGNAIYGTIPSDIHFMTALEYLLMGENQISGSIPSQFALMPELKQVNLNMVPVVGTLPTQLGRMTKLTDLEIFDALVTGPIPTQLGMITGINELAFHRNLLTGLIPSEFGLFSGLNRHVNVDGNNLSGYIPSELGLLTQMTEMGLHSNHLIAGRIPTQFGQLSSIDKLDLGWCELTGPLPSELGLLTHMQTLTLGHNNISGSIPSEFRNLKSLLQLDLTSLPLLSGSVPTNLCQLNTNDTCSYDVFHTARKDCYVEFDCTEAFCGCDCSCGASNNTTE